VGATDLQLACSRLTHEVTLPRPSQLAGPPGGCRPRLGGDAPLLRQVPGQTPWQEGC